MFEVLPYRVYSNKNLLIKKDKFCPPRISLFIAFYNNISFIELVLASVESQSFREFELIICDDGSNSEATNYIHNFMRNTFISVKHVWHSDDGFRKNEALNKGIKSCDTDYIIFIDQDCVLHPEFVNEHYHNRNINNILAGRRLELSSLITQFLTPQKIKKGYIQKNLWWFLPLIALKKDNQGLKGIYIKNQKFREFMNRKKRGVVGCNFSLHKKNLQAVNGFDMRYMGPGTGEDSDIEYRLNLNGIKTKSFLHAGVQYHLYHRLQKRLNANEELFEVVKAEKAVITPFGLDLIPQGEWIDL